MERGVLMSTNEERKRRMQVLQVPLEREPFMRTLIRHLSGTLEEVVGVDEAAGFVSIVGQKMGDEIETDYRKALGREKLSAEQVVDVLVDLKRRIAGDFYVIEEGPEMLLLGNRACPFGDRVLGRPSMCMMTSNVFGSIAAQNLGYAKVELRKTLALGHDGCLIAVYLNQAAADSVDGREYFAS